MAYDIFISYRREGGLDKSRNVQMYLQQYGYKVFFDFDSLEDEWKKEIETGIREAKIFLLMLTPGSLDRCAEEGDWVRREVEYATELGKKIIPVNFDNAFQDVPSDCPDVVRQVVDAKQRKVIHTDSTFEASVESLIKKSIVPIVKPIRKEELKGTKITFWADADCQLKMGGMPLCALDRDGYYAEYLSYGTKRFEAISEKYPKVRVAFRHDIVENKEDTIEIKLHDKIVEEDSRRKQEADREKERDEAKQRELERQENNERKRQQIERLKERFRKVTPYLSGIVVLVLFVLMLEKCGVFTDVGDDVYGSDFDIFTDLSYDEMVYVEGGTFIMGAQSDDPNAPGYDSEAYDWESPVHSVTVSSYYMGKYEVTQGLWEYVMSYSGYAADGTQMSAYAADVWLGANPSSDDGKGENYPAYFVSYDDIVNIFLPRLNKITGKTFRLPTEAEWEYAARGGNKSKGYKYSGSNTIGDVAWYWVNSSRNPHPVGTTQANELGIYDMSGNVWEWCSDRYGTYSSSSQSDPTGPDSGSSRVDRGGGFRYNAKLCRVSYRGSDDPGNRYRDLGFRLVCL